MTKNGLRELLQLDTVAQELLKFMEARGWVGLELRPSVCAPKWLYGRPDWVFTYDLAGQCGRAVVLWVWLGRDACIAPPNHGMAGERMLVRDISLFAIDYARVFGWIPGSYDDEDLSWLPDSGLIGARSEPEAEPEAGDEAWGVPEDWPTLVA